MITFQSDELGALVPVSGPVMMIIGVSGSKALESRRMFWQSRCSPRPVPPTKVRKTFSSGIGLFFTVPWVRSTSSKVPQ